MIEQETAKIPYKDVDITAALAKIMNLSAIAEAVDLKEYCGIGKQLPSANALFIYDGEPVHCRTINIEHNDLPIIDVTDNYIVFCANHAKIGNGSHGHKYLFYKLSNREWVATKTYFSGETIHPILMRAFGEYANATSEHSGLMSAEDKGNIGMLIERMKNAETSITALNNTANTLKSLVNDKISNTQDNTHYRLYIYGLSE